METVSTLNTLIGVAIFLFFIYGIITSTRENKKLYKVRPALHDAVINALD